MNSRNAAGGRVMDGLAKQWSGLAARLGLSAAVRDDAWHLIVTAYSEPHRHYHTLTHIEDVVAKFDTLRDRFAMPESVLLALFFHDIVYDPARQDNEAQSAALLCDRLRDIDGALLNHACFCIWESKGHKATGDADTDLFLDLDMSILGAPWADYLKYAQGVAREYLPVYGAEAYAAGRPSLFLEPTLAAEHIFLTEPFAALEAQARQNLAA
jgi:predicted metal-dependent HD superfamily phosphohydrolase